MIIERMTKFNLFTYPVVLGFLAVSVLFTVHTTRSQESETTEVTPPTALEVLKGMTDTLGATNEFSFEAEVTFDEILASGQKVQFGGNIKSIVKRPGSVYSEFTGDLAKKKIWVSGNTVTVLDENHNFYGELESPGGIDKTMDFVMENYDFSLPLADIFHSDPYGSLTGDTVDGVYVGDSLVRGKECSHLSFVGDNVDWQLWVSNKEPALPCKLVITYKRVQGSPQYEAIFSNWNLSPGVSDSVFKPDTGDAEKIDFTKMKKAGAKKNEKN